MEAISVFDIFKIGVGPSSSHTMGPWKAAADFLRCCEGEHGDFSELNRLSVEFFGSLAKTGKGHGTDIAVLMGWSGADIETFDVEALSATVLDLQNTGKVPLPDGPSVPFKVMFNTEDIEQAHPNTMTFSASFSDGTEYGGTYYSLGGGFIRREGAEAESKHTVSLPFPVAYATELLEWTEQEGTNIVGISLANEKSWRSVDEIDARLTQLRDTMMESMYLGCHTEGVLPGGLNVKRRAAKTNRELLAEKDYKGYEEWRECMKASPRDMQIVTRWVSTLAMAVNEVNAAFGRIVTAPTNGAAGVIPAVLAYYEFFTDKPSREMSEEFLLVAGEIGCLFKKGATISAAEGGCQAEIGVSSAMAAAALTHCLGGTTRQVLMAAEIAMEHHLGMTCDPIGGLVQVPCIERNAMGAMKAITAAEMAIHGDPDDAKVSLDDVIDTMLRTALDMRTQYKETSEGGLAMRISIGQPEC